MTSQRKFFIPDKNIHPLPDLTEIQKTSYQWFLEKGLKELLEESSPVEDIVGKSLALYFLNYFLEEPKFSEETAKERNLTFATSLRMKIRLINKKTGKKIDQEIYFGDIPLMTKRGTFIINGNERVIIQQLIRSAGVLYSRVFSKGKYFYSAKVIPERGVWLEFETDSKNNIWVRIDQQRKTAVTALLRIFGLETNEEILKVFSRVDRSDKKFIAQTLSHDPSTNLNEGFLEVYRKLRPGELATIDNAKSLILAMFFNPNRYDLSKVGRYKINQRLFSNLKEVPGGRVLTQQDLITVISELIRLSLSQKEADDIDHLSNRRIKAVGELVQNRMKVGMLRLASIIRERMSTLDIRTLTPSQLINIRPVQGVIREFFMSSQLSHFMDQVNPLSELEHKRRLTVVGPGGLTRERAGFEVRDVHHSFYGRICPISTPEGQNAGLVGYLSCYARLNELGFMETPYYKVVNGKKTKEVNYLNALDEEKHILVSTSTRIDERGYILDKRVEARVYGRPSFAKTDEIEYMDVAPDQIISVSTSLIPFLEHDDGARALMGTNMQRQAIPLIKPEAPIVGTGIEAKIAQDSGYLVTAEKSGQVVEIGANQIKIKSSNGKTDTYKIEKFIRSNANTCLNKKVVVEKGQRIQAGDVLADGPAMEGGELALGTNLLIAFMPFEGGNYEDAILISSRLVHNDALTSIYINEHIVDVRETKLGPEIITRDIPNISEEKLKNLDAEGIIRIGAEVESGDILVGKITPKGETELSAEEKLLRAIFGEKAKDVRDSSLYLRHGEKGKIIDIRILSREQGDKLPAEVMKSIIISVAELRKIQVGDKIAGRHGNKGVVSKIIPVEDMPYLENGREVDIILNPLGVISRMNLGQILETHLGLAAKKLNYKVASPALKGIEEKQIKEELIKAGFSPFGKMKLFDGKTGEPFKEQITVGWHYIMKLNHMVDDKIHQRSIGPYSLITQQPLGGKAQFGGQRFGEMEVWALEGYGAAHTLQEMLTIKSDDVPGRTKAYESIIRNEEIEEIHSPESFNVLIKEIKGLGLSVEMEK